MTDSAVFTPFLLPGETVRWSGRPKLGIGVRAEDLIAVPFSVLWCSFMFPSLSTPWGALGPLAIFNVCFAVLGVYLLVGRFAHDLWLRTRTHYALTQGRALIMRGRRLTAVDLLKADVVTLGGAGSDGVGSIRFGGETGWQWSARGWRMWAPVTSELIFADIDDAPRVFQQIETSRSRAA